MEILYLWTECCGADRFPHSNGDMIESWLSNKLSTLYC